MKGLTLLIHYYRRQKIITLKMYFGDLNNAQKVDKAVKTNHSVHKNISDFVNPTKKTKQKETHVANQKLKELKLVNLQCPP